MSIVKSTNGTEKKKSVFDNLKAVADAPTIPYSGIAGRLVLLLDKSGSMAGKAIIDLSQAVHQTRDLYSDKAEMFYITFPGGEQWPISRFVDLDASGGTPMAEAIIELAKNPDDTQAILMSDGMPNNEEAVRKAVKGKIIGRITINTIACGDNADEDLLRWIASVTGGVFYKAGQSIQLSTAFKELGRKAIAALTAGTKELSR